MAAVMTEESYPANEDGQEMAVPKVPDSLMRLAEFAQSDNIAELLDATDLGKIGSRVVQEFDIDLQSRSEWEKQIEEGIKLAKQVAEDKSWPWPKAANVKFPLMSEAAISFAARAYPELVKGDVVKAEVFGNDPEGAKAARADRVGKYQSWQMKYEMPYWEGETDSLLVQLPLTGNVFRKVYYDPLTGKPNARMVNCLSFVVNHNSKTLENCRRETEILDLVGNDVQEKMRSGEWLKKTLQPDGKEGLPEEDKNYQFLEQHRWLDLDEDGYEEPYIVTVHKGSNTVVRIVARFTPDEVTLNQNREVVKIEDERFYIQYKFIPNPDGGLYAIGLCNLLFPINESINTVLNQLLDAGTLSNLQGGLINKGIRIKGGNFRLSPGEWKFVDSTGQNMRENIFPIPTKEPSQTLFALLGMLVEAGKSLANLKDVLAGNLPAQNVPATTVLAMIEQGQKVYSAIYKRIYRAMWEEFKAVFRLNSRYPDQQKYATVLDDQNANMQADFNSKDYDICPVADPSVSSQMQRMVRSEAMMQMMGIPGMKQDRIITERISAMGYTNTEEWYDPNAAQQTQQAMQQMQQKQADADMTRKNADSVAKMEKTLAEIQNLHATAIKSLADAEAMEPGIQFGTYKMQLSALAGDLGMRLAQMTGAGNGAASAPEQGGMGGMAEPPSNPMVLPEPQGEPGEPSGEIGERPNPATFQ